MKYCAKVFIVLVCFWILCMIVGHGVGYSAWLVDYGAGESKIENLFKYECLILGRIMLTEFVGTGVIIIMSVINSIIEMSDDFCC